MTFSTFRVRTFRTLFSITLLALLAGNVAALTKQVSKTLPLATDGRLSLENINGDVTIEGWDQNEVSIEATINARTQEGLDRIEVEIEASADRIHIETAYAKGSSWGRNDGGEVEYTIRVPRQTLLDEIELVNGSLVLRGVAGDVRASLVNGRATAEDLAGDVELSTVNGSLEAVFDELGGGQSISLESVNGSLDLVVPSHADATFEASTVHGRIRNDFGLEVEKGQWVGSSLQGSLGGGSARVALENVNGSIEIHGAE